MRNCFSSYHHYNDEDYLNEIRANFAGKAILDHSLKEDISELMNETIYSKIREKLYRCSVTIVLIGEETGKRKWIDWELWASLRPYTHPYDSRRNFIPNGLLGIYLPVRNHSVPDRLQDNIDSGYAVTLNWRNVKYGLDNAVEQAYNNRQFYRNRIDNSREQMTRNKGLFF